MNISQRLIKAFTLSLKFWPSYILYYMIIRFGVGLNYVLLYGFALVLIVRKFPVERIAHIYLILAMITYSFGSTLEANHYMSFVYGALVIICFQQYWQR